jgi:hypothetical protein
MALSPQAENSAVGRAVYAATNNAGVRTAMILGSYLEGGWNPPYGVGDGGTSFGPFQIHLPAHPGVTRSEAEDTNFAVKYMLPGYTATTLGGAVGLSKMGAASAAFRAERPAHMYDSSRVDAAWAAMHGAASGKPSPVVPEAGKPLIPNPIGDAASQLATINTTIGQIGDFLKNPVTWIRIGEFILGGILIINGLAIIARPVLQPVAETAIKAIPK